MKNYQLVFLVSFFIKASRSLTHNERGSQLQKQKFHHSSLYGNGIHDDSSKLTETSSDKLVCTDCNVCMKNAH